MSRPHPLKLFRKPFNWMTAQRAVLCLSVLSAGPTVWAQQERPPTPVVTAVAQLKQMSPTQWVSAQVESRHQGQLAFEVSGRLTWVAEIGDQVAQGAVLARIDDQLLRAALAEAEAEVETEVARLGFLDKEVQRLQRLAKDNNAARTQLDQTQAEHDGTRADLAAARARLQSARLRLERTELKAPFAGVVVHRMLRVGEWADSNSPVLRLLDSHTIEAVATAPLTLLPFIKPGATVDVKAGDMQGQAQVSAVVPAGDPMSQRLTVRLQLDQQPWVVGQALRVALPTAGSAEVIAVPRDALVLRRSATSIYRIKEEDGTATAEFLPVQLGVAEGDWIQVIGPVQPGDQVVTRGNERLRPGQAVQARSMGGLPPTSNKPDEAGQ